MQIQNSQLQCQISLSLTQNVFDAALKLFTDEELRMKHGKCCSSAATSGRSPHSMRVWKVQVGSLCGWRCYISYGDVGSISSQLGNRL